MFENDNHENFITNQRIFDTESVPSYVTEELLNYHGNYGRRYGQIYRVSNTRYSSDSLIRRPDITITINLLREIMKKTLYINYTGLNMFLKLEGALYNKMVRPEEGVEFTDEDKNKIINRLFTDNGAQIWIPADGANIHFYNVIKGASLITKLKEIFKDTYTTTNDYGPAVTLRRLKDLEMFLIEKRYDNVFAFEYGCSPDRSTIIIVTNETYWGLVRRAISKVPELFADEFNKEEELTDYEKNIIALTKALGEKGPENTNWKTILKTTLTDPNRIKEQVKAKVQSLIQNTKERRIKLLKNTLTNIQRNIEDLYDEIRKREEKKRETSANLLLINEDPEVNEMIANALDFVQKCPYITKADINPENSSMSFIVNAPIKYFDANYAEKINKNLNSILEGRMCNNESKEMFKLLFKEIFLEDKYTLVCSSSMKVIIYPEGSSSMLQFNINSNRFGDNGDYLGQPHLANYACLGDNRVTMVKNCEEGDLLGLLTTYITATQNFNLTDSTVLKSFIEDITYYNRNKLCLKNNETGEQLTFAEYCVQETKKQMGINENEYLKDLTEEEMNYLIKALKAFKTQYTTVKAAKQIIKQLKATIPEERFAVIYYGENIDESLEDRTVELLTIDTDIKENLLLSVKTLTTSYVETIKNGAVSSDLNQYLFTTLLKDYEQTSEETEETEETPRITVTMTPTQNVVETTNYTVTVDEGTVYARYEPAPEEFTAQPRMQF